MYIMCGLLLIGFLCNLFMRPVHERHHYRGQEQITPAAARPSLAGSST
jgi:hypothetical protein